MMTVAVFADRGFAPTAHLRAGGGSVVLAKDVQQLIEDIVELHDEAHHYMHRFRGRSGMTRTPIIVFKEDLIRRDGQLELKVRQLLARIIRVPNRPMTKLILDPPQVSAAFIGFVAKVLGSLTLSADGVLSVEYPSLLVVTESGGKFKAGCGLCPVQAWKSSQTSIEACRVLAATHLSRNHRKYPDQSIPEELFGGPTVKYHPRRAFRVPLGNFLGQLLFAACSCQKVRRHERRFRLTFDFNEDLIRQQRANWYRPGGRPQPPPRSTSSVEEVSTQQNRPGPSTSRRLPWHVNPCEYARGGADPVLKLMWSLDRNQRQMIWLPPCPNFSSS